MNLTDYGLNMDKYLTTPPFSRLDDYMNELIEYFSEDFYNDNEEWFDSDLFLKWCDKLCYSEMTRNTAISFLESAQLIERAHKFYKL